MHCCGLGLAMSSASALFNFSVSQRATQVIVNAIIGVNTFELDSHELMLFDARKERTRLLDVEHTNLFNHICSQLDPIHHRALLRAKDNDLSVWLSALPTEKN